MQRATTLHFAKDHRIDDAGNYFASTDVEEALQESPLTQIIRQIPILSAGTGDAAGFTTTKTGGRGTVTHALLSYYLSCGSTSSDILGYAATNAITVQTTAPLRLAFNMEWASWTNSQYTEMWVGFFNKAPNPTTFPITTSYHIGFRLYEAAGVSNGATLYASNGNNTSGNQTSIATNVGQYAVKQTSFIFDGSDIKYYLDNALVATHTTYLPTSWSLYFGLWVKTGEAAAKDMNAFSQTTIQY